jgi:hypothetical protein
MPGGIYTLLASPYLSLPLNQWLPIATNSVSVGGNFTIIATNVINGGAIEQFYILQTQ